MGKIYTEYEMSQTSYTTNGKLDYSPNWPTNLSYNIRCKTQYSEIANRKPETGIVPQTNDGYSLIPRIGGPSYGYLGHMLLHGDGSAFENADIIRYLGDLSTMESSADMNNRYAYIGGLYWAKTNIGATTENESGLFFQFNTSTGRTAAGMRVQTPGYSTPSFASYSYQYPINQYGSTWQTPLQGLIESSYGLNGYWRIPSANDFASLMSNSRITYQTISGVNGILCISKTDDSQSIFLPFVGYVKPTGKQSFADPTLYNSEGYYWQSMGLVDQDTPYSDYEDKFCRRIYRASNTIYSSSYVIPGWYGMPIRPVMGPEQLILYGKWIYDHGYYLAYNNTDGDYSEITIPSLTIRIGRSTKIGKNITGTEYEYADYFVPCRNIYFIAGNPAVGTTNWAMLGWLEKGKQYKLDTDGALFYTTEQKFHYPFDLPVRNGADITFAVVCSQQDSAEGDFIMGYLNGGSTTVDAQLSAPDWKGIQVYSSSDPGELYFDTSDNNGFYNYYRASSSVGFQPKQMLLNHYVRANMNNNNGLINQSIELLI